MAKFHAIRLATAALAAVAGVARHLALVVAVAVAIAIASAAAAAAT